MKRSEKDLLLSMIDIDSRLQRAGLPRTKEAMRRVLAVLYEEIAETAVNQDFRENCGFDRNGDMTDLERRIGD